MGAKNVRVDQKDDNDSSVWSILGIVVAIVLLMAVLVMIYQLFSQPQKDDLPVTEIKQAESFQSTAIKDTSAKEKITETKPAPKKDLKSEVENKVSAISSEVAASVESDNPMFLYLLCIACLVLTVVVLCLVVSLKNSIAKMEEDFSGLRDKLNKNTTKIDSRLKTIEHISNEVKNYGVALSSDTKSILESIEIQKNVSAESARILSDLKSRITSGYSSPPMNSSRSPERRGGASTARSGVADQNQGLLKRNMLNSYNDAFRSENWGRFRNQYSPQSLRLDNLKDRRDDPNIDSVFVKAAEEDGHFFLVTISGVSYIMPSFAWNHMDVTFSGGKGSGVASFLRGSFGVDYENNLGVSLKLLVPAEFDTKKMAVTSNGQIALKAS